MVELAIIRADVQVTDTIIALQLFILKLSLWDGVLITAVDSFIFLFVQKFWPRIIEITFTSVIGVTIILFWMEIIIIKPSVLDIIKGIFIL